MACCKKCPHLESCAQNYEIELYCTYSLDPWTLSVDAWDPIGEFLALKKCKTCTKEYREIMDKQYPND